MKRWLKFVMVLAMFAVLLVLRNLVPHRVFVWGCLLVPPLLIVGIVCLKKRTKKKMAGMIGMLSSIACCCFLLSIYEGTHYSFVDAPFFVFWPISVTLGVITTAFLVFLCRRALKELKWVWGIVLGLFACFVFTVFFDMYMQHFNYLLDASEPQACVSVIKDKDMDLRKKSPDSYQLLVAIEGEELWLEVPRRDYRVCEVGDTYIFSYYNGAFGKAFCMS